MRDINAIQKGIVFSKKLEGVYKDNSIQPLCIPLFSEIKKINFFIYHRFYYDGKNISMSTNPEYIKSSYAKGVHGNVCEIDQLRGFVREGKNRVYKICILM